MQLAHIRSHALGIVATIAFLVPATNFADDAGKSGVKVTPLMQKELADIPGKEGLVLTVELAPGLVDKAHRHEAHVFVYMLEGTLEMQVEGGKLTTLKPGDTFYENPQDIHTVATNPSKTKPAKFLVLLLKNQGVAPVLPVK